MTDLQTLFALDPLQHTTETLDELIADLRDRRAQFSLENNKTAGKMKRAAAKPTALAAAGLQLDLSILDKPE
jgi:hypothetical protein